MDARATRRGIPAVVIWGGLGALAWAALTVLTGGSQAHADEQSKGPVDGATSLVSHTLDAVTEPVAPVVTTVVAPVVKAAVAPVQQTAPAVVAPVVRTVVNAPVVGDVVAPAADVVVEAAKPVVRAVTDTVEGAPSSQVVDPIVDAVTELPVVGELAEDLGVVDAVDDLTGMLDDTTDIVGGVVDETVPPVLGTTDPGAPITPVVPVPTDPEEIIGSPDAVGGPARAGTSVAGTTSLWSRLLDARGSGAAAPSGGALAPAATADDPRAGAVSDAPSGTPPTGPVLSSASASAASGAGSSSTAARISDGGILPVPAGAGMAGAVDDDIPSSPVTGTDVSPD